MKIVGAPWAAGPAAPIAVEEPTVPSPARDLAAFCFSQRARNSAINAVGAISSCWTSSPGQYAKKLNSDEGYDEEPTKKICLRARDNRVLLNMRSRNSQIESGNSQPTNSIGSCFSGLASQLGRLAVSLTNAYSHSSRSSVWIAYCGVEAARPNRFRMTVSGFSGRFAIRGCSPEGLFGEMESSHVFGSPWKRTSLTASA